MPGRRPKLDLLEDLVGHQFADRSLLEHALTHVSAVAAEGGRAKSYQRLEFLGDRVLGLVIAQMLFQAFPKADEGELSKRLAELVRKDTCADVGQSWDVGKYLRLGPGQPAAAANRAIIADVCEAVVGAIFLDGGYPAAHAAVERAFGPRMRTRALLRDAKTALQEWAQARGLPPPTYALVERRGPDHAPEFRIAVTVEGLPPEDATGNSRRLAEQAAAEYLLRREGVWTSAARE